MMEEPLGVALIGTGVIGTVHLKDILVNTRLTLLWLLEADLTKAQDVHRRFRLSSDVRICDVRESHQAYADPRVKCVLICTPTPFHEKLVKDALNAGKAVFCEKPLALTLSGVKECFDLAEDKQLPLFCGLNRRFDPQHRAVHDRIRAGDIGELRVVKTTSRDPPSICDPSIGKGTLPIFSESGIHDIDLICWMVGELPCTVYATGNVTNPVYAANEDIDTCLVTMNFPSGVIGSFEISYWVQVGYDQRVEAFGTKGMLQSTNECPALPVLHTLEGGTVPPIHSHFVTRYRASYQLELEHFVDLVQGKAKPEVTLESTLGAHTVAAACKASFRSGKPTLLSNITL